MAYFWHLDSVNLESPSSHAHSRILMGIWEIGNQQWCLVGRNQGTRLQKRQSPPFPQGFPDSSVGKESTCNAGDPGWIPGLGRSPGEGIGYPHSSILGFPCGSAGTESACNAGDLDSIPGLGRSPAEGNSYPHQCSCPENSMDRGVWQATSPWGHKESDMTDSFSHSLSVGESWLAF